MEIYFLLAAAGFLAFAFSTVAGGGGAMILVPFVDFVLGSRSVAPVVQLGNFLGRPTRIFLFWKHIDWRITKAYLPAAVVGAWIGSWLFVRMNPVFIQLGIAIFLISTLWQFKWGKSKQSFPMKLSYFTPLGFLVAIISTLIGATGPILNPFYLNYGVQKETLIATKAVNSFLLAIAQLSFYTFFGSLYGNMWLYGLAIGVGASLGNYLGKMVLDKISDQIFRTILVLFMALSGIIILVKLLLNWLSRA